MAKRCAGEKRARSREGSPFGFDAKRTKLTAKSGYSSRVTSSPEDPKGLLSMPNELLFQVAGYLRGSSSDLRALAMTCRRLSNIAKEELFDYCRVSKEHMPKLLSSLLATPGAVTKVRGLSLKNIEMTPSRLAMSNDIEEWVKVARKNYGDSAQNLVHLMREPKTTNLGAIVLFLALTPGLETLVIREGYVSLPNLLSETLTTLLFPASTDKAWTQFYFDAPGLEAIWPEKVMETFQNKLVELTIIPDARCIDFGLRTFRNCENLKRLTLDSVPFPENVLAPHKFLPPSLEYLGLGVYQEGQHYDYALYAFRWVGRILRALKDFPLLRAVDLNWKGSIRSFAMGLRIDSFHHHPGGAQALLREWDALPVSISFKTHKEIDGPTVQHFTCKTMAHYL